jgi:hypothetical protein
LHTSQAKVIFGRTSVLEATSAALFHLLLRWFS